MKRRNLLFLAVAALAVTVTGPGFAGAPAERATHDRFVDTTRDTDAEIYGHYADQHGPSTGHLPPTQENVALVGKQRLTTRAKQDLRRWGARRLRLCR
jgi:hypothetical protein